MTCPNCKKIYNNHVTICISCGTELVADDNADIAEENSSEGVFVQTQPPVAEENPPPQFTRNITVTSNSDTSEPPIKLTEGGLHKKSRSLFKTAASAMLSVTLFAVTMLTFGAFALRQLTNADNISTVVRNFDLLSLPAAEIGISAEKNATVSDAVAVMAKGSGLDSVKIRSVYDNSTIKEFLCGVFSQYGTYLRNGTQPDIINADTLKSLFSENISVISVGTGYVISEKDLSLAFDHIDRLAYLLNSFSVSAIESRFGEIISFIRAYISVPVLVAGVILAVGIIAVIAAVNKTADAALSCSGGAFLGAGLVIIALTFMLSMQIGFFDFDNAVLKELIRSITVSCSGFMYSAGGVISAFGTAALIWSFSLKKLKQLQS